MFNEDEYLDPRDQFFKNWCPRITLDNIHLMCFAVEILNKDH